MAVHSTDNRTVITFIQLIRCHLQDNPIPKIKQPGDVPDDRPNRIYGRSNHVSTMVSGGQASSPLTTVEDFVHLILLSDLLRGVPQR